MEKLPWPVVVMLGPLIIVFGVLMFFLYVMPKGFLEAVAEEIGSRKNKRGS